MPRARKTPPGFRFTAGDLATGVAFIANVEGAPTEEAAREKFASIVGSAGAVPVWTRDSSVQVRVYFNPGLARVVMAGETVETVGRERLAADAGVTVAEPKTIEEARAVIAAAAARIDALQRRVASDAQYLKAMDSVIDEHHIARSCINPLVDLRNAVGGIVQERDDLRAKLEAQTSREVELESTSATAGEHRSGPTVKP